VLLFDGRETGVVNDDTHQQLLRTCMKFSQTAVVVLKNSFRNWDTVAEMERLTFSAFQCEMELGYIIFSRFSLVLVAKDLW